MGFLSKLFSKQLDASDPAQSASPSPAHSEETSGITVTISYSGPTQPVSEAEVAEVVKRYNFVLTNELGLLKTADQWFDEATQKRRLRNASKKAYEWLLPFVPLEVVKLKQLQPILELGPKSARELSSTLRALIRECRKTKQPFDNLLHALYNACVLADFAASVVFVDGMRGYSMGCYVDIRELQDIRIEYSSLGYQCIKALSKTDVKWLVEAFGEPTEHQSFDAVWQNLRWNAVSRYCWEELRRTNDAARSLGLVQKTMDEWLHEVVRRNLGYEKEWLERCAGRELKHPEPVADIQTAWATTEAPFAVADLETTGIRPDNAEILELAAVLVEPDGSVTSEFSVLIKTQYPVPDVITRLTGITQAEVDAHGQPISQALAAFLSHIGERPVFFHNAPFDQGFLSAACAKTKMKFNNVVHDTLPLARCVWPMLGSHKLSALTKHIGATAPKHRALGDAHAVLAILLTARTAAK